MKGATMDRLLRIFMALAYGAMIAAFVCIVVFGASGCSTGEVEMGANISCFALSVEPRIKFAGISLGQSPVVVTNVTCTCITP